MVSETQTLDSIHEQLTFLVKKVTKMESNVAEIHDDLHQVKPEYLKKLEKIKRGRTHHFQNKEDFLRFLEHEIWFFWPPQEGS